MSLKKSLIVSAAILVISPVVSTTFASVNVLADESVQEQVVSVKESDDTVYSEVIDVYKNGETTIATISDDNVDKLLKQNGFDLTEKSPDDNSDLMTTYRLVREVTKVVKHENGNYDIYLSSKTLNKMINIGSMGTGALLRALFQSLGTVATRGFAGDILAEIFQLDDEVHGRVFVVRNYVYQYWYYQ